MKNNKIFALMFALFFLVSTLAYARPITDVFTSGLVGISNFFSAQAYRPYAKAIDFFFFAVLFIAVYMMGAKYAFKEVKRPEQTIVILLGLMTAFLLVLGNWSAVMLIPYLHWFLYLLLFLLYWWLLKFIQNQVLRFLTALLLTILTIALLQGLYYYLAPESPIGINVPSVGIGGIGGFFKDLWGSFKTPELPNIQFPGIPDYALNWFGKERAAETITTPGSEGAVITPPESGRGSEAAPETAQARNNWWWLLLPLLMLLLLPWLYSRAKKKDESKTQKEEEDVYAKLIADLDAWIEKKKSAISKIREIILVKEKQGDNWEFLDFYHKIIDDDAFYLDPQHEAHKNLMQAHAETTKLLKAERELEKALLEVMKMEDELIGSKSMPYISSQRLKFTGKVIGLSANDTQKEWYGKLDYWYSVIKKIEKAVQDEYNARLGLEQGSNYKLLDDPKINSQVPSLFNKTTGDGRDLVQGRESYQNEDGTTVQGRPELSVPIGIPDFYGRMFAAIEQSFIQLRGGVFTVRIKDTETPRDIDYGPGLVEKIKKQIVQYYVWTKEDEDIEIHINSITDSKKLERWLVKGWMARWHDIRKDQHAKLKKRFQQEKQMFQTDQGIFYNLTHQYWNLVRIRKYLEALKSNRISMTQMQDLYVSKVTQIENVEGQQSVTGWQDVTSAAKRQPGLALDTTYSVHTRIKEGIGPFKVACYVNNKLVRRPNWNVRYNRYIPDAAQPQEFLDPIIKTVDKKLDEIRFTFEEIGINAPGKYKISFLCMSKDPKVFERLDRKEITINVQGVEIPRETSNLILRLKPINSHREDNTKEPIELISSHHLPIDESHVVRIGKGEDEHNYNNVQLVNTRFLGLDGNENGTQFSITFDAQNNKFHILDHLDQSGLIVNNGVINERLIEKGDLIQLNEYIFEVDISESNEALEEFESYMRRFPVRLILERRQIGPAPERKQLGPGKELGLPEEAFEEEIEQAAILIEEAARPQRKDGYVRRYMEIVKGLIEQEGHLKRYSNRWLQRKKNKEELRPRLKQLFKELDDALQEAISYAKSKDESKLTNMEKYNYEYIYRARDLIYEMINLLSYTGPLFTRGGKLRTPYLRAKEKADKYPGEKEYRETGREPFDAFSQTEIQKIEWREYQDKNASSAESDYNAAVRKDRWKGLAGFGTQPPQQTQAEQVTDGIKETPQPDSTPSAVQPTQPKPIESVYKSSIKMRKGLFTKSTKRPTAVKDGNVDAFLDSDSGLGTDRASQQSPEPKIDDLLRRLKERGKPDNKGRFDVL